MKFDNPLNTAHAEGATFVRTAAAVLFGAMATGMVACASPKVNVTFECQGALAANNNSESDFQGPGHHVLMEFAQAANGYDYSAEESFTETNRFLMLQAKEILLPQKEILHQHALWIFTRLPWAERMDTTGWQMAVEDELNIQKYYEMYANIAEDGEEEPVIFFYSWEMVRLFHVLRHAMHSMHYPAQLFGAISMIETATGSQVVRLNDDGENPVIALQKKNDFMAISFRHDGVRGVYVPEKIEWLVPKQRSSENPESKQDHSASEGKGQKRQEENVKKTKYQLSLETNANFISNPPPPKDETRYKKWKKKTRIRVGKSHLLLADYSPDERYFLTMSDAENTVRIYDTQSKKLIGNYTVEGFSPGKFQRGDAAFWPALDGAKRGEDGGNVSGPLFLVGNESGLALYSALSGRLVERINDTPVWELRFSPDGRYVLCATTNRDMRSSTLVVYQRTESLSLVSSIPVEERIEDMALSSDNQLLALTFFPSDTVTVVSLISGKRLWTVDAPKYTNSLDFSPDATQLAVGGEYLLVVSMQNPKDHATYRDYNNNIDTVRFSPSGDAIASSSYDGRIRIVNTSLTTGKLKLLKKLSHRGQANVYSVEFNKDGQGLVSSSGDQTAVIWGQ